MQLLDDQSTRCNEGVREILAIDKHLKTTADQIFQDVLQLQRQDDQHYARKKGLRASKRSEVDLGQTLDAKIANQDDHLITLLRLGEGSKRWHAI